jgi:hypothetical protein
MKDIKEFKHFAEHNLAPVIRDMEAQRKKYWRTIYLSAACSLPIAAVAALMLFNVGMQVFSFIILVPVLVIAAGFAAPYFYLSKAYAAEYKQLIIAPIVKFLNPNLRYYPQQHIPKRIFESSKLFPDKIYQYKGDDLVEGKVGQTEIMFSELLTTRKKSSRNNNVETVFKGIFFVADFNKDFYGTTLVLPDLAEKFLGGFGKTLQGFNFTRGQLVKLEDPEFEKHFVVYASDQIESRYLLSTSLMQRIVKFRQKAGADVFLSFSNRKLHVAVNFQRDLFEPHFFCPAVDLSDLRQYYCDLCLCLEIVDDLNLNTRIWQQSSQKKGGNVTTSS